MAVAFYLYVLYLCVELKNRQKMNMNELLVLIVLSEFP